MDDTTTEQSKNQEKLSSIKFDDRSIKKISILSALIILFIPTFSFVTTYSSYGPIKETTFFWPWMILRHLQPTTQLNYNSNQFFIAGIPWVLLIFIPFFYILRIIWQMYNDTTEKVSQAVYIVIASIMQILILSLTFHSQSLTVDETRIIFYVPEILLILIYGIYASKWFFEETNKTIKSSKVNTNKLE